jgi:hypothetical protein
MTFVGKAEQNRKNIIISWESPERIGILFLDGSKTKFCISLQ